MIGGVTMASIRYGIPNLAGLDKDASRLLVSAMLYGEPSDFTKLFDGARQCEESMKAEKKNGKNK